MTHARRLPAEWERQAGVMLAWPHAGTDWADSLDAVERAYVRIAREIATREQLLIVCHDEDHRGRVRQRLECERIDSAPVRLVVAPFNDTWMRDSGPLTVLSGNQPRLLKFRFNGWGGKYAAALDDALIPTLHALGIFGEATMETPPLVLEGGSIDVDGAGNMLTTTRCLLNPSRNPGHDRAALEAQLKTLFGIERVLWLDHGYVAGDDTDGHVDMLARFCDTTTIAYTACEDAGDEHYQSLRAMKDELESFRTSSGQPYKLIPLPLPRPVYDPDGQRLPASYSNFLVINDAVLVPTYGDPADEIALRRLQEVFCDREIVGVDCACLVQQYGSLHCMTMQLPAGVTFRVDPSDANRTSTTREH